MTTWTPSLSGRSGPTYIALANAIADAVESGDLTPGERLPARRDLAHALKVSVNTVSSAYQEAERRGYVQGEVGRGTFVRRRAEETFTYGHPAGLIDLSICRPAVIPDQMQAIRDVIRVAADEPDLASMLACRPIIGLSDHRVSASRWLYRLGMPADPNDIVITNGCSHGLFVALSAVVEPDDTVVTDSLTDHGIIALSSLLKFNLKPLATDGEGIRPDSFRAVAAKSKIKALVTTPTLNNPTCTIMSAERREQIAAIAAEYDIAIIEDDVFSPLVEDSPPPLASFNPDNSYYVTSLTKCTVPGMRVGYLVGPSRNTQRLVARVRTTAWMATPLVAELASHWIDDGTIDEIVARATSGTGGTTGDCLVIPGRVRYAKSSGRPHCLAVLAGGVAGGRIRASCIPAGDCHNAARAVHRRTVRRTSRRSPVGGIGGNAGRTGTGS